MIRAVDLGYGAVKGISSGKEEEYPSVVGDFRPIRFTTSIENQDTINKLCVEYEGSRYFIGEIAYIQSSPRATMNKDRFTSKEGFALLLATLVLLAEHQYEELNLVTGLPVDLYSRLQKTYLEALSGKHYIQLINPDGGGGEFYSFHIEGVKILPQPIGTIYDAVLNSKGQVENKKLAKGKVAVLDIGKYTVDLALTYACDFVNKSSVSYSDIGIFDIYKELSQALKEEDIDIPPDKLEPFIRNGKTIKGLPELKDLILASHTEKILSRVINTWDDLWTFDKIFITGGGAVLLGEQIRSKLELEQVEICNQPSLTNCRGYFKYANRVWG